MLIYFDIKFYKNINISISLYKILVLYKKLKCNLKFI